MLYWLIDFKVPTEVTIAVEDEKEAVQKAHTAIRGRYNQFYCRGRYKTKEGITCLLIGAIIWTIPNRLTHCPLEVTITALLMDFGTVRLDIPGHKFSPSKFTYRGNYLYVATIFKESEPNQFKIKLISC